jgi:hypothetical protein
MSDKSNNFYCQKVCAAECFSIDDWNDAFRYCNENNIEGEERNRILHPDMFPCKEQCFDCMAIVGERQRRTREIVINKNT